MRKQSILYKGENILLVRERKGKDVRVIETSGYTKKADAVNQSWLKTNLQTIPKKNRSELSDPFIFTQKMKCYKTVDAEVIRLYLLPECKSLNNAATELALIIQRKFADAILIGHSKGGFLIATTLERILDIKMDALIITPTIGTITGDEEAMLRKVRMNEDNIFCRAFWRFIIKTVGSRRPIDMDMTEGSKLIASTRQYLLALTDHNILSVYATCPQYTKATLNEKVFMRFGEIMDLDPNTSDGMVHIENQRLPKGFEKWVKIKSINAMSLKNSDDIILKIIFKHSSY